jgi:hypothetical protein
MNNTKWRTIRLSDKTHQKLSAYTLKVETYDEAIQRLLRDEKEREKVSETSTAKKIERLL